MRAEVVLRERSVAVLPADHELAQLRRGVRCSGWPSEPLVLFPREQAPGVPRPADEQHGHARRRTRT